jgi:hypothetical protein
VGSEDTGRPYCFTGFFKRKALLLHNFADTFKAKESRVPLVHVSNSRIDPHCPQSADSADTKQDFLLHTGFFIPAVKRCGNVTDILSIFFDIGVQQVQRRTTDLYFPDLGNGMTPCQINGDFNRLTVFAGFLLYRHIIPVVFGITFLLVAIGIQHLFEIPLPVQKSDTYQRQTHIRRCFHVIPGQNSKAA